MRRVVGAGAALGIVVAGLGAIPAQASADYFGNSDLSKYSVHTWPGPNCGTSSYRTTVAPGQTVRNVGSYKMYVNGKATYNGHTYTRYAGVCYQTNVHIITVKVY